MRVKQENIKLFLGESENKLVEIATRHLGEKPSYFRILKKSLDARKKDKICFVYTIEFSSEKIDESVAEVQKVQKSKLPSKPVIVVGSGPSGLFCALRLIERGITPIVVERGLDVDERAKVCKRFFDGGKLDEDCNVQFGEGGAGTFSDGKLNTGTHSPLLENVLKTFVKFGAPTEIEWLNKPHIGSDNLINIVKNMRREIERNGGEILFSTKFEDIDVESGIVRRVALKRGQDIFWKEVSAVVLAIGHSARDTFSMLEKRGVFMRPKDFAVGVRIEHLQSAIGLSQYGKSYSQLPPADYKLVSHSQDKRACFTFCMCPGGVVVPSSSEVGGVVVNGMSNYARNGENANSALIVQVRKEDYQKDNYSLAGVNFQREIERRAFIEGGSNYCAPMQTVRNFLLGKKGGEIFDVKPSYARGVAQANMQDIFPKFVVDTLKFALTDMDKKLRGFAYENAILTAPETRTSSPIRIERSEKCNSITHQNLYPCGEGAGYAGGIASSAVDGIRVADAIAKGFDFSLN